jgi:hypothetical protein
VTFVTAKNPTQRAEVQNKKIKKTPPPPPPPTTTTTNTTTSQQQQKQQHMAESLTELQQIARTTPAANVQTCRRFRYLIPAK